ncbi:MAG: universal stress protein [Acidimicrobiales bacterium]|nr:universal stress protein [Acidimicrobiales bacterium]RZV48347.1 MAG: hypothetical protein EX269_02050 [Acidimicrobiales bacterium]
MTLNPPTEHQLLVFWVGLLVLLVAARGLGALAQRFGQPAVIGELAAGLLLGPSLLGWLAPGVTDWLFPADDAQTAMLFTVGWIGVLLLLVVTGFETDLALIRRLGRAATLVSTGSLVVPAVAGFVVGWYIPGAFVGDSTERYIFALFIAAALSISSLPVIAKILSEMGLMRRNFGQLTLAAGMANDVVGWIGLGFVAGLAQAGGVELGKLAFTVIGVAVFFALAFTVGQRVVDASLRRVRMNGNDPLSGLTVVLVTALTFGVITQWLHVEAVLGAFIAGVILARSRYADHELIRPVETMTAAVFAPIFFATAGLRVDLGLLADGETIMWAAIIVVAASVSKFAGSLLGARLSLLPNREGAALGIGLNARGALEIVIAAVGLSLGVLNERSYTIVVLMAMATSMAAPPLLRRILRNWEGTPDERQRLDLENQLESNVLVNGGGVLVPTRGGVASLLATQIASLSWPEDSEMTLFTAGRRRYETSDLYAHQNVLHDHTVRHEHVDTDDPIEALLDEAQLGYSAIVLGSAVSEEELLSPFAQEVLRRSPIPVIVVRPPATLERLPWAFARAVVPTSGSGTSRPAQEIASYLSARLGTRLHMLHVSTDPANRIEALLADGGPHTDDARRILDASSRIATTVGAHATSIVEHADNPATAIVEAQRELDADLLVISGTSRLHDGELFLGHTIPQVISGSPNTTVVLAVTPQLTSGDIPVPQKAGV